jgi:hypothetical protein
MIRDDHRKPLARYGAIRARSLAACSAELHHQPGHEPFHQFGTFPAMLLSAAPAAAQDYIYEMDQQIRMENMEMEQNYRFRELERRQDELRAKQEERQKELELRQQEMQRRIDMMEMFPDRNRW